MSIPDTRSPQLLGAYWRGHRAAEGGAKQRECPYEGLRTDQGKVTFSQAFRNAWRDGWKDQKGENNDE